MTIARARWLLVFVAVAAFLNSLGNGFAYDDNQIVRLNPVVVEAHWHEALLGPYWSQASHGSGLYRPVTIAGFAAEWKVWKGSTLGFHAVNVVANVVVSLLVLALLMRFLSLPGAFAGALFFAVHPVHVEAVANVVGQAELWAAAAFLVACLLYLDGAEWTGWKHAARLGGLAVLYLVSLGAKEIAVTLPAVLVLLELFRRSERRLFARIIREIPVYLGLAAVLGGYLLIRWSVLGSVVGEVPAPTLIHLTWGQRMLTALSVWPQYLRLMVYPRTLSADYAPAVLLPATSMNAGVVVGILVIVGLGALAWAARRRAPAISLGILWFGVVVLPVSNLVVPAGILLAERTLYLPSVGAALAVAGLVSLMAEMASHRERWVLGTVGVLAGFALFIRTVERNPSWYSTYTVLDTLAVQHPESYLALRARASGLVRVGEPGKAAEAYETALRLVPRNHALQLQVADFYGRQRNWPRAEQLLRTAIAEEPKRPDAYRVLAEQLIRQGRPREGFLMALRGIARATPTHGLWAAVSEAYIAKGDLEAAARARRAALSLDPKSRHDWERLADILQHLHRDGEAAQARARARALPLQADRPETME
jgi:tetratricopeptide (TPR) repeat protein